MFSRKGTFYNSESILSGIFINIFKAFILLMVVLITMISIKQTKKADNFDPMAGNITVQIIWPEEDNVDIDLWVKDPADMTPVGFSHKSGIGFNLLRDDLGDIADTSKMNYEFAFGRGLYQGEYIVNIQYYQNHAGKPVSVPVHVIVEMKDKDMKTSDTIIDKTITLNKPGDEETAIRFQIDKDFKLDGGSENDTFYSMKKDMQ